MHVIRKFLCPTCEILYHCSEWLLAKVEDNPCKLDVTFHQMRLGSTLQVMWTPRIFAYGRRNIPMPAHEAPLYPVENGMWFAMSRRMIVGPIFFENTINSERYINIAHESQYCIYEFRQNGPSSLVYDVINIHNTGFSFKNSPGVLCMYTYTHTSFSVYISVWKYVCILAERCDIVIRSPTSYPVRPGLFSRLAGRIICLKCSMILSTSYTKLLSSYHQQATTVAFHTITRRH